jgi:hypothetical protein
MIECETTRVGQDGVEYKYVVRLSTDLRNNDGLEWNFYVLTRDSLVDVIESNSEVPEKKFHKNKNFFGWQICESGIPNDSEMLFSKMKQGIYDILDKKFFKTLKDYKSEFSVNG